MLPAYWRAVQAVAAALLDRHGLTGAEVGRITFAANAASTGNHRINEPLGFRRGANEGTTKERRHPG